VPNLEELAGMPAEQAAWMLAKLSQSATNGLAQWWYEHREVPRDQVAALARRALWEGFGQMLATP
jgi:hypothetical protein